MEEVKGEVITVIRTFQNHLQRRWSMCVTKRIQADNRLLNVNEGNLVPLVSVMRAASKGLRDMLDECVDKYRDNGTEENFVNLTAALQQYLSSESSKRGGDVAELDWPTVYSALDIAKKFSKDDVLYKVMHAENSETVENYWTITLAGKCKGRKQIYLRKRETNAIALLKSKPPPPGIDNSFYVFPKPNSNTFRDTTAAKNLCRTYTGLDIPNANLVRCFKATKNMKPSKEEQDDLAKVQGHSLEIHCDLYIKINNVFGRAQTPKLRTYPELDERITETLNLFPLPLNNDEVILEGRSRIEEFILKYQAQHDDLLLDINFDDNLLTEDPHNEEIGDESSDEFSESEDERHPTDKRPTTTHKGCD